jgi:hypothetical protein
LFIGSNPQAFCIDSWRSSQKVIITLTLMTGSGNNSVVVGSSNTASADWNGCISAPQSSTTNVTLIITAFSFFASPNTIELAYLSGLQLKSLNSPSGGLIF